MSSSDLESRIGRLEAIEAIKALKARYWHCCDSKARFEVCSAVTYGWKDASVRLLHAGASLPAMN